MQFVAVSILLQMLRFIVVAASSKVGEINDIRITSLILSSSGEPHKINTNIRKIVLKLEITNYKNSLRLEIIKSGKYRFTGPANKEAEMEREGTLIRLHKLPRKEFKRGISLKIPVQPQYHSKYN